MALASDPLSSGIEPIPGYILREKIGAGGFGEVWSVEAPGGLEKAIKLVFGSMDSERAQRELRSLERLRRVHHPFLLTLERFEVIENRLMIVTERADEGLDQIVARYHQKGLPGIPREELLNYLTEAADALDYLREKYGLQHLDIKPANLLILSGHMKVADFGLVKDLRDNDHSMVGGLTPTYAAPEVFDGKPSIHSDQYSLAIVYQELLTGQRPFNGRTIAQLATQHVHSPPNLASLPSAERPIIARALEKVPERRFESCAELMRRVRDSSSRPVVVSSSGIPCEPSGDTQLGGPGAKAAEVKDISDPLQVDSSQRGIGTALVIGLGGVGADVLAKIRSEWFDRQSPQLRCLLMDTDAERLEAACTASRGSERLSPDQTMHLPLKTAHEYRESGSRLAGISRRWLYNVPRSGRTEGLRPIGRLALVDHSRQVINRLKAELQSLPHDSTGIVYVVGSLAGGTGSGMVWDIVHLVRSLLDESNRADTKVRPLIAIAWPDSNRCGPLHLASTLAALREANHYANAETSYSGDANAGFPPVPAGRSPLQDTYLIAPRNDENAADLLSQYLLVSIGPAASSLEAARGAQTSAGNRLTFRTSGVAKISYRGLPGYDRMLRESIHRSLRQTLGRTRPNEAIVNTAIDGLLKQTQTHTTLWTERWLASRRLSRGPSLMRDLAHCFETMLPENQKEQSEWSGSMILHVGDQVMAQLVGELSIFTIDPASIKQQLMQGIQKRLVNSQLDFVSALDVLRKLIDHLQKMSAEQKAEVEKLSKEIQELSNSLRFSPTVSLQQLNEADSPLMKWALTSLRSSIASEISECAAQVATEIQDAMTEFTNQTGRIAALVLHFKPDQEGPLPTTPSLERTLSGKSEDGSSTEAIYQASILVLEGIRRYVVTEAITENPLDTVPDLSRIAEDAFTTAGLERPEGSSTSEFMDQLAHELKEARPTLLDCGGEQRRMLFVGDSDQQKMLEPLVQKALESPFATVVLSGIAPVLVHEAQSITAESTMARLTTALGPEQHLVDRLLTRSGIGTGESPH